MPIGDKNGAPERYRLITFEGAFHGRTLATIAAGGQARIVTGALEQGQTMTGFIANAALGDSRVGSIEYNTLFAVGLLLFTITLLINFISIRFVRRFREAY